MRIGTHITIVPTSEAKKYRKQVIDAALAAGIVNPLLGRVAISVRLYPHRPLDWAKRERLDPEGWDDTVQCLDLDNVNKVVLDSLKGVAIEDDKWVRSLTALRMRPDENGARLLVRIEQTQL